MPGRVFFTMGKILKKPQLIFKLMMLMEKGKKPVDLSG